MAFSSSLSSPPRRRLACLPRRGSKSASEVTPFLPIPSLARLLKSKQAFSQLKRLATSGLQVLHNFFKNIENIAKCLVIAITCYFVQSYIHIPDMSNRQQLYILDWLAYNRSTQTLLIFPRQQECSLLRNLLPTLLPLVLTIPDLGIVCWVYDRHPRREEAEEANK